MNPDEGSNTDSSRRDFLKKSIKVTGYVIPTIMIFKMRSAEVWAQNYETRNPGPGGDHGNCNTFLEKIFNPKCW